jgi:nucleotidyltransferase substrate binding protein (TIGR01987 family)
MLNINILIKSLESLKDILNQDMNEYIRDGVIQRFEYSFELCWKSIAKYFKDIGRADIPSGPKPLIREAGKEGLIEDVNAWFDFLQARNSTSHIYNENEAITSIAKLSV